MLPEEDKVTAMGNNEDWTRSSQYVHGQTDMLITILRTPTSALEALPRMHHKNGRYRLHFIIH